MLLIAHRTPDSASACAALHQAGADLFEVDVQLRHGTLVVSHYAPLARTGLQRDNWRLRWGDRNLPELAPRLAAVPAAARVLLDPKERTPEARNALVDALIERLSDRERFVVSTGSEPCLRRLSAAGFETWHSIGDRAGLQRFLANGPSGAKAATVRHTLLDAGTLAALRAIVGTVIAWTVNDIVRADELARLGVEGVTTDRVRVMRHLTGR